jgi:fused signal recognition particle receptor
MAGCTASSGEDGTVSADKPAGWLARLGTGLRKSSGAITGGLTRIFTHRRIDAATIDELEDLLITADLGPATAAKLAEAIRSRRFPGDADATAVADALAAEIAAILAPHARPLEIDPRARPHVVLVVGVNGTGKTTTIGKLAAEFIGRGHSVMVAAGDTFRAAAIEQLRIWASRAGAKFHSGTSRDPAAVAFDAVTAARAAGTDVLLIDTAGRLHNKADLMAELDKIIRVLKKVDPAAPHTTLLVLDATTGQNAHAQAQTFRDITKVTGLVVTKLDGSARGGVVVSLADRLGLPIHAIGVGEGIDDLRPFSAEDFARSLVGLPAKAG